MRFTMRFALLAGLLFFTACGDDHHDHEHGGASGKGGKGGSGGTPADAGVVADGGSQQSKLEPPGSLPRPPTKGLPAELRPPR